MKSNHILYLGWLILALGLGVQRAAAAERPNFLVILCDDLGYGDLGCYGHKSIKTPHLDKLATEGIRFTDCYAAAPVCSDPSSCFSTWLAIPTEWPSPIIASSRWMAIASPFVGRTTRITVRPVP